MKLKNIEIINLLQAILVLFEKKILQNLHSCTSIKSNRAQYSVLKCAV